MATVEQLQARHEALEKQAASNPDGVRLAQVKNFVEQVREAGETVEAEEPRSVLQTILSQWAAFLNEREEEPVDETLASYQAPPDLFAPPPEPPPAPTAVSPYPEIRTNRSAPPEWMVRGIMVLVIAALAIGGYFILQNFFETDDAPAVDAPTPTLEATTAAIIAESQVTPDAPTLEATPTAVVVIQVVPTEPVPAEETAVSAEADPTAAPLRTHVVNANDSLFTIAGRYGVTIEEIIASNELVDPNRLEIGQELIIPFPGQTIAPTAVPTEPVATQPPAAPTQPPAPAVTPEVVIRAGEQTAVVPLFVAPNPNSEVLATLSHGSFGIALGLSEDRGWYLIELNNGQSRGWVTVQDAALISPARPEDLPLLRVVGTP